tara:strand:- start:525 stop:839 length:315 start_codon:yes stop_codon:yes gene_type:complete
MMSTFYATQSRAGYIIFQIINGLLSIANYNNGSQSLQNQNQDQQEDVSLHNHPLREYNVTLSSGGHVETIYILARNSMQAAYSALELAGDRNSQLINVQITDEW